MTTIDKINRNEIFQTQSTFQDMLFILVPQHWANSDCEKQCGY